MAFDLGTRLHVRIRTKLENWVLRNGQPRQSVVNGRFSDQDEFETLSSWEAARYDEHQFCAKIKVSA